MYRPTDNERINREKLNESSPLLLLLLLFYLVRSEYKINIHAYSHIFQHIIPDMFHHFSILQIQNLRFGISSLSAAFVYAASNRDDQFSLCYATDFVGNEKTNIKQGAMERAVVAMNMHCFALQ